MTEPSNNQDYYDFYEFDYCPECGRPWSWCECEDRPPPPALVFTVLGTLVSLVFALCYLFS